MSTFTKSRTPNPYGYAPKPIRNGKPVIVRKLTALDHEHMRQWYRLGFGIEAIAKEYDVTYGYTAQIVRAEMRLQRKRREDG
jgi:hypothetical protein